MNTEGFSRAALGDIDEGARLLRAAVELASREGTPSDHVRAVINLSEVLDLSGRTDEALAVVRATLPLVRAHAEPSSYDTFLETPAGVRAAAARPHRRGGRRAARRAIPGDAIGTTRDVPDRRAGADRDACAATTPPPATRSTSSGASASARRDPQWIEALELMSAQLAAREGRLEDARAAAARGLAATGAHRRGRRG